MHRLSLILLSFILCICGCAKKEAPPPPSGEPPAEVSFTDTNVVVKKSDINTIDERKSVKADFDMDGLEDLAVIEEQDGRENTVSIYIQKKKDEGGIAIADKNLSAEEQVEYYKAGVMRQPLDGTVIGLLIRKRKNMTDLIVLLQDEAMSSEMLHYFNDGKKFYRE